MMSLTFGPLTKRTIPMTVKELIEKLKKMPPNYKVYTSQWHNSGNEVTRILFNTAESYIALK